MKKKGMTLQGQQIAIHSVMNLMVMDDIPVLWISAIRQEKFPKREQGQKEKQREVLEELSLSPHLSATVFDLCSKRLETLAPVPMP